MKSKTERFASVFGFNNDLSHVTYYTFEKIGARALFKNLAVNGLPCLPHHRQTVSCRGRFVRTWHPAVVTRMVSLKATPILPMSRRDVLQWKTMPD